MKLITPDQFKEFSTLKDDPHYFIAESERVVEKLFLSDLKLVRALVSKEFYAKYKETIEQKLNASDIHIASKSELEQITGFKLHHGVMIKGQKPDSIELDQLGDKILIFDRLAGAENIGSIIRSSAAFGFSSYICSPQCIDPYIRRAVRVSMGNIFHSKVHYAQNLIETIHELKERGYSVLAAENRDWAVPIDEVEQPKKLAIIIGSEAYGIAQEIFAHCDATIKIPISDEVYALNASIAASILCFHFALKRN